MSTSDPNSETVLTTDSTSDATENATAMSSLPDLEVITRLANEFFAALPGHADGRDVLRAKVRRTQRQRHPCAERSIAPFSGSSFTDNNWLFSSPAKRTIPYS
jgi:hypothetical protein